MRQKNAWLEKATNLISTDLVSLLDVEKSEN
jgi:hypothetical protein